ncbi:MAG: hypothetical protein IH975_04820 [Nitrospinae bacterium]|nr:hypothetical protein [Nitrospinota bacterium]
MSRAKKTKGLNVEYELTGVFEGSWDYDGERHPCTRVQIQVENEVEDGAIEVIGVEVSKNGDERYFFDGVIKDSRILGAWWGWSEDDDPYWYGEYEGKVSGRGDKMAGTYTYIENGIKKREGWKAERE